MQALKKVIWAEGILLGQQHFQQLDNYFQAQQRIYTQCIAPLAWGLITLKIDEDALLNNQFRIKQCTAIYPNGLLVDYDANENQLLSCQLSATCEKKLAIYLCLPINQQVLGITGYRQSQQSATWVADYQNTADIYDGDKQREVLFGKLNLQLLQEHESREQFHSLKIAELINIGESRYQLVTDYIPPTVHIQAITYLQTILTRLLEIIEAKIRVLNERRFEQDDATKILLLQILNGAFVQLQHIAKHLQTHPERLFVTLTNLTSQLGAFNNDFSLHSLPNYQHEQLTARFTQLNDILVNLLDSVMPTRMISIKLRRESDSLYVVDSIDSSLFERTDFFIAVYFPAQDTKWIDQFARQIKVASHKVIENIITSALSGVNIVHTQRPPNKLSVKPGYEYFYLEQAGPFWDQIKQDKNLGIFLPFDFIKATIELVTVQK
jgi:type VI secretion system protein ImpJ